jgi:hypothetical protein
MAVIQMVRTNTRIQTSEESTRQNNGTNQYGMCVSVTGGCGDAQKKMILMSDGGTA